MKIKLLSEATILKIAAGEIIERPASVVKELIENAIDAGAGTITVEVFAGGLEKIIVSDDGVGMAPEDLALAVLRHSTSKITDSNDLFNISSMGFRGEALASIGAVSEMTIATGQKDQPIGSVLTVAGGVAEAVEPAANPGGTRVTVSGLFYNTPVRKKFLRKAPTEFSAIAEIVHQYLLAQPGISFKLFHNQKSVLSSPGTGSLVDAIASAAGLEIADRLIECRGTALEFSLSGYIVGPEQHRSNREMQYFTVNNRPVNLRLAGSALEKAYHTLLPSQRYPLAFLNLTIPPEQVDVNVHPAKRQLKFQDAGKIFALVYNSCLEALKPIFDLPQRPYPGQLASALLKSPQTAFTAEEGYSPLAAASSLQWQNRAVQEAFSLPLESDPGASGYTILGQVFSTFLVIAVPGELRIVDQHAAQERVLYEKYLKVLASGARAGQIVIPIEIQIPGRSRHFVEACLPQLKNLGFGIQLTDDGIIVKEAPLVFKKVLAPGDIIEIIEQLQDQQDAPYKLGDYKQAALMLMACKGAIKANQRLSIAESMQLLTDLDACENSRTCPHGRPTWIAFTRLDLEKLFARK